jgi:uncharacterized protein
MRGTPRHFEIKSHSIIVSIAFAATLAGLLVISAQARQGTSGPSFPCAKARSATEKVICSDRELSALDVEYSQLYERQLKERSPAEGNNIRSNAKFHLPYRDRCASDRDCVADWYYLRTAELSALPSPPPAGWTPRLIGGVATYTDRNRGLPQTQEQKPLPMLYFKTRDGNGYFKWLGDSKGPSPADMDQSAGVYSVYQNVLGSLTYVIKNSNDGRLVESYFFNNDGSLAGQTRYFRRESGKKLYLEYETIYYGPQGEETRRFQSAYSDSKKSEVRKELSPPRLEKPVLGTFQALSDEVFKNAAAVDADQLGICIIDLAVENDSASRIVNFPARPLEVYRRFPPAMSYRTFDAKYAAPGRPPGSTELLGSLGGKKVYVVRYSGGLTGVVVERETDRYLPVLYVQPELKIDQLEVMKVGNEDLLAYSTTMSGSGHFKMDHFFTLDHGIPKSVHYRPVLFDELNKILPKGYGLWKGGGFNSRTFVFSYSVWKEGDTNCCGTGGSVEVVFGFEKGNFVVRSSRYNRP